MLSSIPVWVQKPYWSLADPWVSQNSIPRSSFPLARPSRFHPLSILTLVQRRHSTELVMITMLHSGGIWYLEWARYFDPSEFGRRNFDSSLFTDSFANCFARRRLIPPDLLAVTAAWASEMFTHGRTCWNSNGEMFIVYIWIPMHFPTLASCELESSWPEGEGRGAVHSWDQHIHTDFGGQEVDTW